MCFLCRKGEGQGNPLVEQFIARKADILFCPTWKTATHQEEGHEEEETAAGVCWLILSQAPATLSCQISLFC